MTLPKLALARAALRRREERRREIMAAERSRTWRMVRLALKLALVAFLLFLFYLAGFYTGELA